MPTGIWVRGSEEVHLIDTETRWRSLHAEEHARAFNTARRVLQDDDAADEIADATFVRVYARLAAGYAATDWPNLVGVIAHGLAVNEYHRRMREIPYGLNPEPVYEEQHLAQGQPLTIERAEFQADFDRALRALPAPERDAFILTQLRGLSVRDAADELDVSYRTVARRAEAARASIREEIA